METGFLTAVIITGGSQLALFRRAQNVLSTLLHLSPLYCSELGNQIGKKY